MRVEKCLNEIVNRLNKTKVERKPDLKAGSLLHGLYDAVDLSQGTRDLTDVKGLQPELPDNMHPKLLDLMQRCWEVTPTDQPSFSQITVELEELLQEVQMETQGGALYSQLSVMPLKSDGSLCMRRH
ncbi:uncharacterized protein LOC131251447 isoform X2 [Magnolia sinica]|uniref:uncharacterized protein LOC131251447 isoform X2 n=1 Tax=Magnolia sinica TaxID=86752 RepID=UPI0026580E77|nr:uncharacterized protein LOC131251447 isoform X2 [Magnolia sinica]